MTSRHQDREDVQVERDKEESENDKGQAIQECYKDQVIQYFEGSAYQELIVYMSEGNDAEVEQKVRNFLTGFKEMSGLDKGHFFRECVIRWAVEAERERKRSPKQGQIMTKNAHVTQREKAKVRTVSSKGECPGMRDETRGRDEAKKGKGRGNELIQVAPDREAGGSHPPGHVGPRRTGRGEEASEMREH